MIENIEIQNLLSASKPIYETRVIEFKKANDLSSSVLETVSAFANSDGGNIILGIHNISGKPLKYIGIQSAESIESKIRDKLRNEMVGLNEQDFQVSIENFEGYLLPIIKIYIARIADIKRKPVYIKEKGIENGSFIRIGQRDEHMPKYMLEDIRKEQMVLEKKIPPPELQTENNSSLKDLNLKLVKDYAMSLHAGIKIDKKTDLTNFLESKNIIKKGKLTKFGLLCFCDHPEKYLTYQAAIQVSNETGVDIARGDRGKNKELFEGNLSVIIDKAREWTSQNMAKERKIIEDGSTIEENIVPLKILRELIVNAFCHKDYDKNEKIILKINDIQISIENPGLLRHRIYHNNFIIPGKTEHPNPSIAKYLFRMLKAEGEGKGFTSLLQVCLEGFIDIPCVTLDFSGRVKIELFSRRLTNKEIMTWLETKKYIIKIKLNEIDKIILAYLYKANDLISDNKFVINLSEECLNSKQKISLRKLISNDLIIQELSGSTKIFRLNKELLKNDFTIELLEVFGEDFNDLDAHDPTPKNWTLYKLSLLV